MRIRIKDIAARAKVSQGTVDRVLHNRGEVSAATRRRVMSIAKELNYEPNILASNLASKRKVSIATLMPACVDADSKFWLGPQAGMQIALEEIKPFNIEVSHFWFNLYDRESFTEQAQHVLSSNPDGVVIAPIYAQVAHPFLTTLAQRGIPYVLVNSNIPESQHCLSFIGQDSFQSGCLAARLMHIGLSGRAKLIILNILRESSVQEHIQMRENGFREYFRQHPGIELTTVTVMGMDKAMLDSELSRLLVPGHGYEGLFVTNSKVYKAAQYLESKNIEGIRVIGYDLVEPSRALLAMGRIDFLINQRPEEQGYKGLITIFQHLVLRKNPEREQYMPLDIITKENLLYYR